MNDGGIRRAAAMLAAFLVGALAAWPAFGAGASSPARNAMTAALRVRSVALDQRYGLGSYALGAPRAAGAGPRGFSWSDASLGASVGAAIVLAFAAAALAAARWRRRPAI
ncbi:MAG TPA: hypothetical protein VFA19_15595 [Gaiellaceae bacterium]|nr:hypothetical protein [Gaiellaceae bacterium]